MRKLERTGEAVGGFRRAGRALAVAGLCLSLWSCGLFEDEQPEYFEQPVETLYNNAMNAMQAGEMGEAARLFDEVERQHPYSSWAAKAQIMAAYANYLENRYDEAINALERFIQLHPGNKDIDYAYYLKAISYYEQISDVRRDQRATQQSLAALEELVYCRCRCSHHHRPQ